METAQEVERQKAELARLAAEAAARRTFGDAIAQWGKLELSWRKNGGREGMRMLNKDVLPILGDVALVDVKRAMLVDILDGVVERGARIVANRLFADLRQFFNFAVTRDWVEAHPLAGLSREKIGGREKERKRYLSEEEIIELNKRLPAAKLSRTTELAIWIMLSTCCRIGELSQARWEDVNLDSGEWLIPAGNSKNAKDHLIFLSDFTKEQFQALYTISAGSGWRLTSRGGERFASSTSISSQIRERVRSTPVHGRAKATKSLLLSGGSWTPHDLRRTGATMMGELGIMGEVIERCLNHVERNSLKRIYQRHELKAERREAWLLLGERITLLLTVGDEGNVILGRFAQTA
uniref:Integrase n=1 Tax=Candidatus Kentrum sp. TC TaxID=2126339 RepID=A0A450ZUE0_9GAMM|nr:MAG: Integrase [Candidatus Kentron sp. TC]